MTTENTYQAYAQFIQQQLAGDYFKNPNVLTRLSKTQDAEGELSRLFNDMPHNQNDESNQLYSQVFGQGYQFAYQNMHQLVQITLKHILDNQASIQDKLPPEHQDLFNEEKRNYLIQALITLYALELNRAFDALPQEQKTREQDEFMYFRNSLDTLTQQLTVENIFSKELIKPSEEANRERIEYLDQMWGMKDENVLKKNDLKNTLFRATQNLDSYIKMNKTSLSSEDISALSSISERLDNCRTAIHNDTQSFAIIYQDVSAAQNELKSFKHALKERREQSVMSKMSHQAIKYIIPSKTISGINAELERALNSSRPEFLLRDPIKTAANITTSYKDKLDDIYSHGNRTLSDASTASITSSDEDSDKESIKTNSLSS